MRPAALRGEIFLQAVPVSVNDLADRRKPYGCDNLNFNFKERGTGRRRKCAAVVNLPQYPIAEIQTGQFTEGRGGAWEEIHRFGEPVE